GSTSSPSPARTSRSSRTRSGWGSWPATADADEHQPRAARARRPRAVSAKARSVLALRQVAAALEIAAGVLGVVGDARLRGRHAALRDDQEVLADAHLPA